MKPKIVMLILLVSLGLNIQAQTLNYLTSMSDGNINEQHMVIDRHGNTYLTTIYADYFSVGGLEFFNDNFWTSILIKFNPEGEYEWGYSFVGTGITNMEDIALDKGDGVVLAGSFTGTLYINGVYYDALESQNGILVGFSPEGNVRYATMFGSNMSDDVHSICVDKTGNKFVLADVHDTFTFAGESVTPVGDAHPSVICKFNKNGIPVDLSVVCDFSYFVEPLMVIDNKNNFVITGRFLDTAAIFGEDISNPGYNIFATKLDPLMNVMWTNVFPIGGFTGVKDIAVDKSGNPYLLFIIDTLTIDGNTYYNATPGFLNFEGLICKLNKTNGHSKWANKINTTSNLNPESITINGLQNVAVCGYYEDYLNYGTMELTNPGPDLIDGFVLITDPDGNALNLFDLNDNDTYDELLNIAFDNESDMRLYGYSGPLTIGDFTVDGLFGGDFWITEIEFGTYKSAAIDEATNFTLTPNPAVNYLQIHTNESHAFNTTLKIVDITGRCVFEQEIPAYADPNITINIEHLAAGAYIVIFNKQQQQLIITK